MLLCPAFKITHMKIFIFEKMILRRITFILYTMHLTLKKKSRDVKSETYITQQYIRPCGKPSLHVYIRQQKACKFPNMLYKRKHEKKLINEQYRVLSLYEINYMYTV